MTILHVTESRTMSHEEIVDMLESMGYDRAAMVYENPRCDETGELDLSVNRVVVHDSPLHDPV